jgi:hypothetical protein
MLYNMIFTYAKNRYEPNCYTSIPMLIIGTQIDKILSQLFFKYNSLLIFIQMYLLLFIILFINIYNK